MNNKNGISLIEIIVATGLLAAVLAPVFLIFSSGNRNMEMTEAEFRAHNCAIEIMEQIISIPYKHIKSGSYTSSEVKNGLSFANSPILYKISENYDSELKIEDIKDSGKSIFKKIIVKISYQPTKNSAIKRSFTLKTMVANETN
ncbi:MAG: hypothetical protein PHF29_10590 [Candidatus Riflebacteria bacterium]|nr:hypothetical protein [Candidatus Riflebacteria bacterium]